MKKIILLLLVALSAFSEAEGQEASEVSSGSIVLLKTNLLYDALLIPNLGLEVSLGRSWSLSGNWMYAWWKNDRRHNYWRVYGGDFELSRWFGGKVFSHPLTGHHAGVYFGILTYDFELGHRGFLGDRWSYMGGISYGFSLPLGRRLNLDISIGMGYFWGRYKEYLPQDDHYVWQSTKYRHWFGPTKGGVSLVWLLGSDYYTRRKGVRR